MVTREEAIKRIETHIVYHQSGAWPFTKTDEALEMAIAALREQDVTDINVGGKWVSVEERLPKKFSIVLAYDPDDGVGEADWDGCKFHWTETEAIASVTHWMPMPEPPEVEE